MSSLTEEELNTIKTKNPQLIFLLGPPGVGKTSQIEKVSNEFRYGKIDINKLIDKEIISNSELGIKLKENSNEIDSLTSVFVKGIIDCNKDSILIDSFSETLEQYLHFEKNIIPISLILNFNLDEENGYKRILEQQKNLPIKMTREEYKNKYDDYNIKLKEIIDFYEPYGFVRNIDVNKQIGVVNTLVKENLYLVIYSIIGKRY